jgi:hypothetical protein
MDTAVALEELSTISPANGQDGPNGQADQADEDGAAPDPTASLTEADGLTEVGRYAARLAAFERTVLPLAEQRLSGGGAQVGQVREGGQQLTTVLHWLDRYLTGDARVDNWPGDDLAGDVQAAVAYYAKLERDLIGELAGTLDEDGLNELIRSYHQAEQVAPTRPHPKLSYDGTLGRLKFRLAGLIDDVRDGTESRPAGTVVNDDAAEALHGLDADIDDGDGDVRAGDGPAALEGAPKPPASDS